MLSLATTVLMMSIGFATTPAAPPRLLKPGATPFRVESRRRSASPVFPNPRRNKRQIHESHLTRAARGGGGPVTCIFLASRAFKSPGAEGPLRRVGARFSRLAIRSPSSARVRCKVGPLQELPELPGATDRPRKVVERLFRRRRGRLPIRIRRGRLNQLQTLTPRGQPHHGCRRRDGGVPSHAQVVP